MKIISINPFKLNQGVLKQNTIQTTSDYTKTVPSDSFVLSSNPSPVSFGQSLHSFRNLYNIPCPCCGIKMIPPETFNLKFTKDTLSEESKQSIKILDAFTENMHPIEKACFDKLKKLSKKKPQCTLQELLLSLKKAHLKLLKEDQLKVLEQIKELKENLSEPSVRTINHVLKHIKTSILNNNVNQPFKRKSSLDEIMLITKNMPEKDIAARIYETACLLPSSSNDLNAFIVKYSQKSAEEIGKRLISPSVGTLEHIKPKNLGGKSSWENYLLQCGKCNSTKSNLPLDQWLQKNPKMVKNVQTYINAIIKQINKGDLQELAYPKTVAKTLYEESKGVINIEIPKLTTPKTKKEREFLELMTDDTLIFAR